MSGEKENKVTGETSFRYMPQGDFTTEIWQRTHIFFLSQTCSFEKKNLLLVGHKQQGGLKVGFLSSQVTLSVRFRFFLAH